MCLSERTVPAMLKRLKLVCYRTNLISMGKDSFQTTLKTRLHSNKDVAELVFYYQPKRLPIKSRFYWTFLRQLCTEEILRGKAPEQWMFRNVYYLLQWFT